MDELVYTCVSQALWATDSMFNPTIVPYINMAIMELKQLGAIRDTAPNVTPTSGRWRDYIDTEVQRQAVEAYIIMSTMLLFDPPQNAFIVNIYKEKLKELQFRLEVRDDDC